MTLTSAQKLLNSGKPADALALLPPADRSTDPRLEILRARIQTELGQEADAAATLSAAIDRYPDHPPLHLFKGIALWDLRQPTEAMTCFEVVLRFQKHNQQAASYIGLCQLGLGQHDKAAETFRKSGFSDNTMFRVRTIEFVESAWLRDRSYFYERPDAPRETVAKFTQSKALRAWYARRYGDVLKYVSSEPTSNDLEAFLAASSLEMLGHYSAAEKYVVPFEPQKAEWPEPFIALNARLLVRRGEIAEAAKEFAGVVIMGPEDFGINYYLGVICLAYERQAEARKYFVRALTNYMVDTIDFQWWQVEQVLLNPEPAPAGL